MTKSSLGKIEPGKKKIVSKSLHACLECWPV